MTTPSPVLVLGAGMVGVGTALHLQQRGHAVTLVDRREAGHETSHGNAGLIQAEAVEPYPFPRDLAFLFKAALDMVPDVHWHANALPGAVASLWRYYQNSAPAAHARITLAYSRLIAHAVAEHAPLIAATQSDDLVKREGFRFVYRTPSEFDEGVARAQRLERDFGVRNRILDGSQLAQAEPAIRIPMAGGIHWLDPWSVSDPGELTQRYARLFEQRGGQFVHGDATTLQAQGGGWKVQTDAGWVDAPHTVIALGPWSFPLVRELGYQMPVFVKRGYHQHYSQPTTLNLPILDAEKGYVLAPMRLGLRLTTGAEFAHQDAPATPVQLAQTEAIAHDLVGLADPVMPEPWLGARPCTADMLPVIGAAPRHPGLWFNFGHAHQGFTLGPTTGRLLAEMISGETTLVDPTPYSAARFD